MQMSIFAFILIENRLLFVCLHFSSILALQPLATPATFTQLFQNSNANIVTNDLFIFLLLFVQSYKLIYE